MTKKNLFKTMLLLTVPIFVLGIPFYLRSSNNANSKQIEMVYDSARESKEELLRFIPIGTEVAQARSVLSENDFSCQLETPSVLECEKRETDGLWMGLGGPVWYVFFKVKDKRIIGTQVEFVANER